MATFMKKIDLSTEYKGFHEITEMVQDLIGESGIKDGFALLHCHHTTASLTITSFWDPRGHVDMMEELDKIVPTRNDFHHQFDTPTDASGHIKTSLLGSGLTVIVKDGKAFLGSSQGIFLAEFDGPRERQVYVKVFSDY
jgi:secondary thiamine-phosphate synthase enzyme